MFIKPQGATRVNRTEGRRGRYTSIGLEGWWQFQVFYELQLCQLFSGYGNQNVQFATSRGPEQAIQDQKSYPSASAKKKSRAVTRRSLLSKPRVSADLQNPNSRFRVPKSAKEGVGNTHVPLGSRIGNVIILLLALLLVPQIWRQLLDSFSYIKLHHSTTSVIWYGFLFIVKRVSGEVGTELSCRRFRL